MAYSDPAHQAAAARRHYDGHRDAIRDRNTAKKRRLTVLMRELKDVPCTDCHQRFHFSVMDFDHRDGTTKIGTVSSLTRWSESLLLAEVGKCDVVCSNCHRVRTWTRMHSGMGEPVDPPGLEPGHLAGSTPAPRARSVSSTVMDVDTIKSYALTMKEQADRLHKLIQRSGGPHAGPPLDVHTVGVLLRGIEAERVLHLCSIIDAQQSRITDLETRAMPQ